MTSDSGQNGVMGNNKKTWQNETTVFKTLYIKQQKTVISERFETSETSPVIALAYYLENISRLCSRYVELRQSLAVSHGDET